MLGWNDCGIGRRNLLDCIILDHCVAMCQLSRLKKAHQQSSRVGVQDSVFDSDGPSLSMRRDKLAPHRDSFAKKTVAFFKISRSMRGCSFSRRNFASSASWAVSCPREGSEKTPRTIAVRCQIADLLNLVRRTMIHEFEQGI